MAEKRLAKNVLTLSVASALLALFTYIFVSHHRDTPNRAQQDRSALLSTSSTNSSGAERTLQTETE